MAEPLVFISYTAVDRELAQAVADGLTRRGVRYFFDREHGGAGMRIADLLDDALNRVSHVLLIASPAALQAHWVQEEYNAALALAVRRALVIIPGRLNVGLDELPPLLGSRVAVDLTELEPALDEVARVMRGASPPQVPGGLSPDIPRLPDHHQPRPDLMAPFKQSLLGGATSVAVSGLHGMGGVGKTVLASALARDSEIQHAFPDGILWVSLGEAPDMAEKLSRLAASAGIGGSIANQRDAAGKLTARLANRRVLLIADDVWRQGDLDALCDLLPAQGALLVTTRDSRLLRGTTVPVEVDALTPDQARGLLAGLLDLDTGALPPSAGRLIRRVGRHPLALAISARLVNPRDDLESQLAELCEAFEALDKDYLSQQIPNYHRGPSVFDSLEISLIRLEAEDCERFLDLAVFPEDARVPVPVLGRLWGTPRPHGLADRLVSRSLARLADGHLSLHDLQRDFARFKAGATLVKRHQRLTEAYRAACGDGWGRLDDDGYGFRHLPWHLRESGETEALRRLLLDYGWIAAKLAALGPGAFPADTALLPEDVVVQRVGGTINLSAHVLAQKTPRERRLILPSQILGRLAAEDGAEDAALLASAKVAFPHPALLPRRPVLERAGGPLLRRMVGHTGWVLAVAVAADGRRAVSGSADTTLGLWDLDSGTLIRRLEGHTGDVRAVAVTADGRRAVSGSDDKTLGLWDLERGTLIRRLEGHTASVRAVAMTADGRRAVSGSLDRTLGLWDLDSGTLIRRLEGHTDWVWAVAVTADGRRAVSGSDDKTVGLWNLGRGTLIRRLEGHAAGVQAVAVTADGRCAVSGSDDHTLGLWDLDSGTPIRRLTGHTSDVSAMAVTADGKRAVSSSWDSLWDLDGGTLIRHTDPVTAVAVTVDGRRAVSSSWDSTLGLWDLDGGTLIRRLEGHTAPVTAVAVTVDGRRAVSGSADRILGLWDLDSDTLIRRLVGHTDWITAVAVTADGRRAISGSFDRTLGLWDLDSGTLIRRLKGHTDEVRAVAVTADGRRAVSGSDDKTLGLWDLDSGTLIRRLEGHTGEVWAVAVTADGRRAISGSDDQTLGVWDLDSGALLRRLEGHTGAVTAVALLANDRLAISASRDSTLRLWDLASGACLAMAGCDHDIRAVAAAGPVVVAGDDGGLVHVFDFLAEDPRPCPSCPSPSPGMPPTPRPGTRRTACSRASTAISPIRWAGVWAFRCISAVTPIRTAGCRMWSWTRRTTARWWC